MNDAAASSEISRYQEADRSALLDFRRDHYGPGSIQADPAYVDWQFRDAPGVKELGAHLFIARQGTRVVGAQACIRTWLQSGDERIRAAWVVDFAVRAEFRDRGIGKALGAASRREPLTRLVLDATAPASHIAARADYQSVGIVPLFVRPLAPEELLRAHGAPRWLAAISHVAGRVLGALGDRARTAAEEQHIELLETSAFDERADKLFADISVHYPLVCRRDRVWLEWRFERYPVQRRYRLFHLMRDGETAGYAVLRMGTHWGIPAGVIVDYLCPPGLILPLLGRCGEWFREAGAAVISCLHLNPFAAQPFRTAGYFRRKSGWPLLIRPESASEAARSALADSHRWFLTAGDSNVDRPRD
jgi:GNAT superfamily N-acetyltransferase